MDMDTKNYASHGVGSAALTTGIIGTAGTALGLLGGNLGGLFGGMNNNKCADNQPISRYESALIQENAAKDGKIALLEANIYNDSKTLELYKYIDGKIEGINAQICAQAVVNAQVAANIGCMQSAIATLQGLTKTVIPIGNVCPQPMPEFNSWTAPTTTN